MRRKLPVLFVIVATGALAAGGFRCTMSPLAGGGTESTNGYVVGALIDTAGMPAKNARVWLRSDDYNPVSGDSMGPAASDTTDSLGMYAIRAVHPGTYTVQAVQLQRRTRAICFKIPVADGRAVAPTLTLQRSSAVDVALPADAGRASGYVYVPGTDILVRLGDETGSVTIDSVPAGVLPSINYGSLNMPVPRVIRYRVPVSPHDTATVLMPDRSYSRQLVLNTSPTGAAVPGTVLDFPVLVRLTSSNFRFSEAMSHGEDVRFTGRNGAMLSCEIERWDAAPGAAELWVRVDTVFGGNSTQYVTMYWGASPPFDSVQGGHSATVPQSNGSRVFDTATGFQGVWHLQSTADGTTVDATGNHFNGTPHNMTPASTVAGAIGFAQKFNGLSDYLLLPGTSSGKLNFPEHGTYSISAWVRSNVLDGKYHVVVSKGDFDYTLQQFIGNEWEFSEFLGGTGWEACRAPITAISWAYLTSVRSGSSEYLYVNGLLADSSVRVDSSYLKKNISFDVTIGKIPDYSDTLGGTGKFGRYFNGMIDEVRISSVANGPDWIKLCYMNQKADDALVEFR